MLPEVALVICHAGMWTVMTALRHGIPLVCVPAGRDQDNNAQRVAALGAGRVLAADAGTGELREAVADVLGNPSYRHCPAGRILFMLGVDLGRCAVAALGLVVALVAPACGDGESEQAEAVSPESALACIEDLGWHAWLQPVADPTQVDPTVYLNVDASRKHSIGFAFFDDPDGAQSYVELQAQVATSGLNSNNTERVGPTTAVTVDFPRDIEAEREIVSGCF